MKKTFYLSILVTLFASSIFAQTLMPAKQVSAQTNTWTYIPRTNNTAQKVFDWLDDDAAETRGTLINLQTNMYNFAVQQLIMDGKIETNFNITASNSVLINYNFSLASNDLRKLQAYMWGGSGVDIFGEPYSWTTNVIVNPTSWWDSTWWSAALVPSLEYNFRYIGQNGAIANWNMILYSNLFNTIMGALGVTNEWRGSGTNNFVREGEWFVPPPGGFSFTLPNLLLPLRTNLYSLNTNMSLAWNSINAVSNNLATASNSLNNRIGEVSNSLRNQIGLASTNAEQNTLALAVQMAGWSNALKTYTDSRFTNSTLIMSQRVSQVEGNLTGQLVDLVQWGSNNFYQVFPYLTTPKNLGSGFINLWAWNSTALRTNVFSATTAYTIGAVTSSITSFGTSTAVRVYPASGSPTSRRLMAIREPGLYLVRAYVRVMDMTAKHQTNTADQGTTVYSIMAFNTSTTASVYTLTDMGATTPANLQPYQPWVDLDAPPVSYGYYFSGFTYWEVTQDMISDGDNGVRVDAYAYIPGSTNKVHHTVHAFQLFIQRVYRLGDPEYLPAP
jgi:hypothetical protein